MRVQLMQHRKVLVLAPHTDDAELGAGGAISRMVEEGVELHVAAFSTAEESLPEGSPPDLLKHEFLRAMPELGVPCENLSVYGYPVRRLSYHRQEVLDELVRLRRQIRPDLVLLPSGHDLHQDHQVLHAEGLRAFRDNSIWGYELPWNNIAFSAQAFVLLERRHIEAKWKALSHYKSQIELARPYFTWEFIEALARVHGVRIKRDYAETFEVLRLCV
jgi:N-acetylglucosamine malate deacetylase 1